MFRALTKDLDLNEILDLLADNHIDKAHVYLEPLRTVTAVRDMLILKIKGIQPKLQGPFYRLEKTLIK